MQEAKINIVSFSVYDHNLLKDLAGIAGQEFGVEALYEEKHIDLSEYLDSSRSQYKGDELLEVVEKNFADNTNKTIGLFNVDLYIPILTFIYGQAYLGGNAAIASSHRLSNTRYGLKEDPKKFRERIAKEVIHELGHTFGLIHCYNPTCVMRSSTYVEEIDQKDKGLCSSCMEKYLGFPE